MQSGLSPSVLPRVPLYCPLLLIPLASLVPAPCSPRPCSSSEAPFPCESAESSEMQRLPGPTSRWCPLPTASQMGSEASLKTVLGDASLKATHPSLDSSHCWTFLSLAETCHDLCPLVAAGFLGAQHSRACHLGRALSLLQACARCAKNTKTWAHPPGDHGTVRRLNRKLQSNVRSPPIDRVTRWPMRVRA